MLKYLLAGACALFLFAGVGFCADEKVRTITVSGEGTASATPDVAYVHLGVLTDSDTVSKAMTANKTAMTNVFKTLKDAKIADKDICTTNFQLAPKYKYVKDEDAKLVGYTVSNDVIVTVRDLDKSGDLLDALAKDGHANRVTSFVYDVLDKEKAMDTAREAAVANALKKAKLLTKAAGANLDKVLTITEGGGYSPRAYSLMNSRESSGSTPLAKGERQFKVTVNLVISLRD